MQLLVLRQPFDRRDVPAAALRRENQARQHPLLVKKDRAGSARTLIAALLRAGQAEMLAQRVQQGRAAVQMQPPRAPVDATSGQYRRRRYACFPLTCLLV
jgi:hypothetical protein